MEGERGERGVVGDADRGGAGMFFVVGESGSRWGAEISSLNNTILKI